MPLDHKQKILLAIDAAVNLALGILLILFPPGMLELLGLPHVTHYFYTTILGAVIFGIGIALLIDIIGDKYGVRGLGIAGAIAINLCGGGALLILLIVLPLDIPLRGYIILWSIAIIVLGIGLTELLTKSWKMKKD